MMLLTYTHRAVLLGGALLGLASCRCQNSAQCPAFDTSSAIYALPAEGDSIRFSNSAGEQIVFGAARPFISPTYAAPTTPGFLGSCTVSGCDARASSSANSSANRNGANMLTLQYSSSSDAMTGQRFSTYGSGQIFDFYFPMENATVMDVTDTTLYDFQLGSHTYDTLRVLRRDTIGFAPQNFAIWRVYLHRPEGVVGFEDRTTASLFYRD